MDTVHVCIQYILLLVLIVALSVNCAPKNTADFPFVFPTIEAFEIKRELVDDVDKNIFLENQPDSTVQRLNTSRNTDLLFGEVTEKESALLLHCHAPYSVQWIFSGDSDPEFNTNTSTTVNEDGQNLSYSAYLYLGSRRSLNEKESGKYICSSVRSRKLSSFLYIFVTKAALFTNKGLETIYFSERDDLIRIPCSLSEPRAVATLQKSEDGVLKCPMNDSVRFNTKDGFLLNPKRLQNPEGTYLCIASYHPDNTFQIIKYTVKRNTQNSTSEESDSTSNEPVQTTSTLNPTTPSGALSPTSTITSTCANKMCGLHASCYINKNGDSVCRCHDGFTGNPYVECKQASEFATPIPSTTAGSESAHNYPCDAYDDCPTDRACFQNVCQSPCQVNSICGPHTTCKTEHHTPVCECMTGFEGDPYSSQQGQQCEKSYCDPNPCGPHTICKYANGIISCSCEPGYSTQQDGVCRPNQRKKASKPGELVEQQLSFSPPRPIIRNTTHTLAPGKECHYDTDCPDDKMCIQEDTCEDPCINACGSGALCHVRNHFPRCLCPTGTTGDPFYKCVPLFSEVLGTSTNNSSVTSSTRPPSPVQEQEGNRYNCGGDNSPCGPNTVCQASRHHFVCVCPNGFFGDAYSPKGCVRRTGYLKCEKDSDCPHFLSCLKHQGCVNPCNVKNVCKSGLSCVPFLHRPACLKTDNFNVDIPRDGLASEKVSEETNKTQEDFVDSIPDNNRCFVRKDGALVSACGKNSICFDLNVAKNLAKSSLEKEVGVFCGCMENYIGDAYVECKLPDACTDDTQCERINETCIDGLCRENVPNNVTTGASSSKIIRNPCSPSPCTNAEDTCVILRSNNSAKCIPAYFEEIESTALPSIGHLRADFKVAEEDTTNISEDFTILPPPIISTSYLSSASLSSLEDYFERNASQRHFVDSLEATPSFFSDDEETVVDV